MPVTATSGRPFASRMMRHGLSPQGWLGEADEPLAAPMARPRSRRFAGLAGRSARRERHAGGRLRLHRGRPMIAGGADAAPGRCERRAALLVGDALDAGRARQHDGVGAGTERPTSVRARGRRRRARRVRSEATPATAASGLTPARVGVLARFQHQEGAAAAEDEAAALGGRSQTPANGLPTGSRPSRRSGARPAARRCRRRRPERCRSGRRRCAPGRCGAHRRRSLPRP